MHRKQQRLDRLVQDIRQRSVYLINRETFVAEIFERIKEEIRFSAIGVSGVAGKGIDLNGITCGIPHPVLDSYSNSDHVQLLYYSEQLKVAQKNGYSVQVINDVERVAPDKYRELYEPFGFTCGMRILFTNSSGGLLAVSGGFKSDEPAFTETEQKTMERVAPYILYCFLKYRWLVNLDFMTLVCFDEFPFGILTASDKGRITYINDSAKNILQMTDSGISDVLPQPLMAQMRRLEEIEGRDEGQPCLIFRNIETYVPPYGVAMCYRFDEAHGGKYLPVKGKGYAFFIDSRKKDMAQKALLSERELDVIRLVGQGLQDKEISHALGISEKTVQTHMQNIFSKLDTDNRTEAAVKAIRLGLL